MLQRIQSLVLGLIIVLMIVFLNLPFWEETNLEKGIQFTIMAYALKSSWGLKAIFPYVCSAACACIVLFLALYTIVVHNNRPLQGILVVTIISVLIGLNACLLLLPYKVGQLASMQGSWSNYKIGAFLPIVSAVLSIFVLLRIQKDHRLVNDNSLR
ncbi:MAG TPA: DUF4293 family protein [Amoebophilaceae bacterium]|jgi:hypothetical protein|nr:DUF4293 family protein [Amoebophilaceae bacterium]